MKILVSSAINETQKWLGSWVEMILGGLRDISFKNVGPKR